MVLSWPIFSNFGGKNFSLNILALPRTTSYEYLALRQNLAKTNDPIPRKHPDRRKVRWTDTVL